MFPKHLQKRTLFGLVLRVAYGSHFQVLSGHFPGSSWRNSAAFCQGFAWNFDFASALNRRQTWIGKAKLPVCNGTISKVSGIQRRFFSLVIYYFKSPVGRNMIIPPIIWMKSTPCESNCSILNFSGEKGRHFNPSAEAQAGAKSFKRFWWLFVLTIWVV